MVRAQYVFNQDSNIVNRVTIIWIFSVHALEPMHTHAINYLTYSEACTSSLIGPTIYPSFL